MDQGQYVGIKESPRPYLIQHSAVGSSSRNYSAMQKSGNTNLFSFFLFLCLLYSFSARSYKLSSVCHSCLLSSGLVKFYIVQSVTAALVRFN